MLITETKIKDLHELAYDIEKQNTAIKDGQEAIKFEKERADLLAKDKAGLKKQLEAEQMSRKWQPMNTGDVPDDVRIMVRSKDGYAVIATKKGTTWLSGRSLLDFEPAQWMLIPD